MFLSPAGTLILTPNLMIKKQVICILEKSLSNYDFVVAFMCVQLVNYDLNASSISTLERRIENLQLRCQPLNS